MDRAGVLLRTITAQVNAQLRPGADASRADAELAAARTQWIQAQQAADVARATLSQFVGVEPAQIALDISGLLQLPPEQDVPALDPAKNPIALEQNAAVEETQARLRALERSYFPTLLSTGRRVRARLGRGDQRKDTRRSQRSRAQRAKLRPRIHRDFPGVRPAGHSRPRGRANRHHTFAAGQVRADLDRPARPMESRRGDAERRAPHRGQHAHPGVGGAHRHAAGDGAL